MWGSGLVREKVGFSVIWEGGGKFMGVEEMKWWIDSFFDKFGYKEEEEKRGLVVERGRRLREEGFFFFKMRKI